MKHHCFKSEKASTAVMIIPCQQESFKSWLVGQPASIQQWVSANQFSAQPGSTCLIANSQGQLATVLLGVAENDMWVYGALPLSLPEGDYFIEADQLTEQAAIAWGLGAYQFTRYKAATRQPARLYLPASIDGALIENTVASTYLARDLVNTPTEDMGPSELQKSVDQLAKEWGAKANHVIGDALLKKNFTTIHAVGRASDDAPRLLELRWGDKAHRKVTLVGKGVCFDTGGLDLKTAAGMALMKKDMGGAAHVLGLARMIMAADLPICLRVLIPAVENAVSGNAFRPGDVIKTRQGLTVEIGNTDAEGRLVLCDALAAAAEEAPDLIVDFATLTGAAKVALGPSLPGMYTADDALAQSIFQSGAELQDPVWRLPLHQAYRSYLESKIADINNMSAQPYAGSITAALFLSEFVPKAQAWVHFDIMAWNVLPLPGRPVGGEAHGVRAVFDMLRGS